MLIDAIRARLGTLTNAEERVARAILADPRQTIAGNLGALAEQAGVSQPTVVRFCRMMGFDGWQSFKLNLAQGIALALPQGGDAPAPGDIAADLVDKISRRSINTLLDLRNHLDAGAIQRALELLAGAARIECYGHGTSAIVAADAQHKLFRLGVPAVACSDPHVHAIAAALLKKGDVVLAFSQRGHNPALLQSVRIARDNRADVIAIAPGGTPLAQAATVAVPVDVDPGADLYTPISARLAHLVVVDILAVGLALQRGPALRRTMRQARRTLQQYDMQFDAFL